MVEKNYSSSLTDRIRKFDAFNENLKDLVSGKKDCFDKIKISYLISEIKNKDFEIVKKYEEYFSDKSNKDIFFAYALFNGKQIKDMKKLNSDEKNPILKDYYSLFQLSKYFITPFDFMLKNKFRDKDILDKLIDNKDKLFTIFPPNLLEGYIRKNNHEVKRFGKKGKIISHKISFENPDYLKNMSGPFILVPPSKKEINFNYKKW